MKNDENSAVNIESQIKGLIHRAEKNGIKDGMARKRQSPPLVPNELLAHDPLLKRKVEAVYTMSYVKGKKQADREYSMKAKY